MPLDAADTAALTVLAHRLDTKDYYGVFGLAEDFGRGDLRKSYYALSRRFHPDNYFREDLGEHQDLLDQVFAGINLAYRTLGEPDERHRYDRDRRLSAPAKLPTPPPRPKPRGEDTTPRSDTDTPPKGAKAARSDKDKARRRKRAKARKRKAAGGAKSNNSLRQKLMAQLRAARRHAHEAKAFAEAEDWAQAARSWYLAGQFDPRNADYKVEHAKAEARSKADQVDALMADARQCVTMGNKGGAAKACQRILELDPTHGAAAYFMARLLQGKRKRTRDALDYARTAAEADPNNPDYHMVLGELYEAEGLTKNAHREFKLVLKLRPRDPAARKAARRTWRLAA